LMRGRMIWRYWDDKEQDQEQLARLQVFFADS
jgi:hypothetical protein